jgi:hypothetical protein
VAAPELNPELLGMITPREKHHHFACPSESRALMNRDFTRSTNDHSCRWQRRVAVLVELCVPLKIRLPFRVARGPGSSGIPSGEQERPGSRQSDAGSPSLIAPPRGLTGTGVIDGTLTARRFERVSSTALAAVNSKCLCTDRRLGRHFRADGGVDPCANPNRSIKLFCSLTERRRLY